MLRQVLHPWKRQILRNSRFSSTPEQGTQRNQLNFQSYNSVFAINHVVHAEDKKTTSRVNAAVHPHRETQKRHMPKGREAITEVCKRARTRSRSGGPKGRVNQGLRGRKG